MSESTVSRAGQQSCTEEQEARRRISNVLSDAEQRLGEYLGLAEGAKDPDFATEVPGLLWSVRVLAGCVQSFCPPASRLTS
jgi:hypothetical protein